MTGPTKATRADLEKIIPPPFMANEAVWLRLIYVELALANINSGAASLGDYAEVLPGTAHPLRENVHKEALLDLIGRRNT